MLEVVRAASAPASATRSSRRRPPIALGAMFGKLLADSGGADQIVDTIVGRSQRPTLPWSMAVIGAIIGLPMFFESAVLLMPVDLPGRQARRAIHHRARHPGARRTLRDARVRAAAPRAAGGHPGCRRRPRAYVGARHPGRDPHDRRRRAAVRRFAERWVPVPAATSTTRPPRSARSGPASGSRWPRCCCPSC